TVENTERHEVVIAAQWVRRPAGGMKIASEGNAAIIPLRLGIIAAVAAEVLVEPPHVRGWPLVLEETAQGVCERVAINEIVRLPIRPFNSTPDVRALTLAARRKCRGVGVLPRAGKPWNKKRASRCRCRFVMRLAGVN